ncbi:hypothetical protein [Bradyrhizobium sp. Arg816]|uniref:hypothetical protein n=1 Tax=Bradyrhizobium sp. Arg816 TaxID=2998491 RepID=UPI00249F4980|nr:hypothetical protein [Bradyrhizobium sp. Arg816]MDI3563235.1 hypothetical protein [Bradyrhizobium sp. Arg816]
MPKTLLAFLIIPMLTGVTSAQSSQSKRYFDLSGRSGGTSSTDSQGTTTIYDARGKVIGRESSNSNATTLYDVSGRVIGRRQ